MVKVRCDKCGEIGYSARRIIKCQCGGICFDVTDAGSEMAEAKESA